MTKPDISIIVSFCVRNRTGMVIFHFPVLLLPYVLRLTLAVWAWRVDQVPSVAAKVSKFSCTVGTPGQ